MKEISIEEKAKRYDEAIKVAADIKAGTATYIKNGTPVIDAIFPELKKSEGWIPKEIIKYLKEKGDFRSCWIAWLEKQDKKKSIDELTQQEAMDIAVAKCFGQGEQKPTDKVEPKFKVGDWVVNKFGDVWHIDSFDKKNYQVSNGDKYNYFPISKQNEMHLWTIQDAKDGDVLEFGDHGRLVVGIVSFISKRTGRVDVYCLLEANNFKVGNYYALDTINPHPATKEQRDLLFQKMKEAGYEWDAEKKKN